MKLINRIIIWITVAVTVILSFWAFIFYYIMVKEINDEVDDSLNDYSELIIIRSLAGKLDPVEQDGTNNSYSLNLVSESYARSVPQFVYKDSMVYIAEKKETEPARVLRTVFKGVENVYYELEVSTPTFEKEDLQRAIWVWIVILYLFLLFVLVVICVSVVYHSMQPLYSLLHWLDHSSVGGSREPLRSDTTVKEFKKLHAAVRNYARRAEEFFEQQKQFIGNAAHELQTPIAICQNRLEMLLEETECTESQMIEIGKTLRTLNHLSKLNKSLLLLSKIENHQFKEEKEVHFNRLLRHSLEDYKEVYAYKKIQLMQKEEGDFRMKMDESLASVLLTNLLKNAYVHTPPEGTLQIRITSDYLVFQNTAVSGPLEKERIFERFYQIDKKEGSAGLGLAIAHSICRVYEIRIRYLFRDHCHVFELQK